MKDQVSRKSRSYRRLVWDQFRRDKVSVVGLMFVLLLFAIALTAPLLAGSRPLIASINGKISFPVLSRNPYVDWKKEVKADEVWAIFPIVPYGPTDINLEDHLLPPAREESCEDPADGPHTDDQESHLQSSKFGIFYRWRR